MPKDYPVFRFWCQKVLPLVYDESLSYYETLCKVIEYLNNTMKDMGMTLQEMKELKEEVAELQNIIDNFDVSFLEEEIKKYLAKMIYVEISDTGYIVYHIPKEWDRIKFNTTGLDIELAIQPEYGHLVLSY